jgi:hypothetical protein
MMMITIIIRTHVHEKEVSWSRISGRGRQIGRKRH